MVRGGLVWLVEGGGEVTGVWEDGREHGGLEG